MDDIDLRGFLEIANGLLKALHVRGDKIDPTELTRPCMLVRDVVEELQLRRF